MVQAGPISPVQCYVDINPLGDYPINIPVPCGTTLENSNIINIILPCSCSYPLPFDTYLIRNVPNFASCMASEDFIKTFCKIACAVVHFSEAEDLEAAKIYEEILTRIVLRQTKKCVNEHLRKQGLSI
jgi:hypothetical protein